MSAEHDTLAHCFRDRRMRVALHHRPVRVVEVDHLGAVDIPDVRAAAVGEIDRPGLPLLVCGGNPAHERLPRAFIEGARTLRTLVETPLLALRQLGDTRSIEVRRGGCGQLVIVSYAVPTRGPPDRRASRR